MFKIRVGKVRLQLVVFIWCGEGKLFSEFLKNGIKFDDQFVIMANQYDMETKKADTLKNMEEEA